MALLIARIGAVIALLVYITFLMVAVLSGSLGGALIFAPAVTLGLGLAVVLMVRPKWRGAVWVLAGGFAIAGGVSFSIMFKFIQPTVLPKKVVPIGNPWVIEGNIFTNNDWNNAVVIRLDDGTYRMYFHDKDKMDTAASTDGKKFGEVTELFRGEMPTVIRLADGRWRMYYFVNAEEANAIGGGPAGPQGQPGPQPMQPCDDSCKPPNHHLVSAVSRDGLHWTRESGLRLAASDSGYDRDTMIHPSVVQLGDGSYKLYYDGEVDPTSPLALAPHYRKILSASSQDGLTWTRDAGYRIDEKPVGTWEAYSPKAMYANGKVTLRFTTPNGIYEATSTDTMNFTISKNPIFSPGRIPMPGPDGAMGSYQDAYVLPVDGGQRMYFWIAGQGIFSAFQKS